VRNTQPWLKVAPDWFVITRHEDPDPQDPPTDPEPTPDPDPEPEPEPAPEPPAKGKDPAAEVEKWKAQSRKHEAEAKKNAAAAKRLAEIDAQNLTETEKLTAAKERAEAQAAAAIKRAVFAEVKALASTEFADPTDAETVITPADYIGDDGDIDVEAIKAKLEETLAAKPHWRKPADTPPKPRSPKPDPGQGPRGGDGKVDFRTATPEEYQAEMAKLGLRTRS